MYESVTTLLYIGQGSSTIFRPRTPSLKDRRSTDLLIHILYKIELLIKLGQMSNTLSGVEQILDLELEIVRLVSQTYFPPVDCIMYPFSICCKSEN